MSFDTLRTSKMRSALTVLGVVIGITSIVGMTSLIRGFDQSLRDSISQLGPEHDHRAEVRRAELRVGGKSFLEVARRPNLTREDANAIERDCPSVALVDVWLGGARQQPVAHLLRARADRGRSRSSARPRTGPRSTSPRSKPGRVFIAGRGRAPAPGRASSGRQPVEGAVPEHRSDRQDGADRRRTQFTVIGVLGPRPSPGGFGRRRRLRDHPLRHAREGVRQGAEGFGQGHRRQLQPGGVPHGHDRGRAARRPARRRRCARSRTSCASATT